LGPPEGYGGQGSGQSIKFSSDEEMVEYYREALMEAVVFCTVNGYTEEYIISLDVDGFGEIYRYLKRLETRRQLTMVNDIRLAVGADEKVYKKFIKMKESWLPRQEKMSGRNNSDEFKSKLNKGL
jgi:hypothetical protein